jgi:tetratricopeptide (TPR) repeat protein
MSGLRDLLKKIFGRANKKDTPAPPEPLVPPTPQDAHAWSNEAQRLAKLGQWEEAIACYDEALTRDPQNAYARFSKGLCLAAQGYLEEAIAAYDQAVAIDSELEAAWFGKALAEEQIGRTQDAMQSFERYIAAAPAQDREQIEYAVRRHRELASRQEDNTAPPAPSEPEPSTPMHHHPPQAQSAGAGADQKGDQGPEESSASRDQALDDSQQDAATLYGKGLSMAALGRLEDAVDCYKQALALDPGLAVAWFSKALAEERIGREQEAALSYERYIALAPSEEQMQIEHARQRVDQLGGGGEDSFGPPESLEPIQSAPTPQPPQQDTAALVDEGRRLAGLGRHEEALVYYDRALALDPQNAEAWQWHGVCLIALHRLEEAVTSFDRALAINPQDVGAWYTKGVTLFVLRRTEEFVECFDRVSALNPQDGAAWINKGNGLVALGRLEEALACFEKAVALAPRSVESWHQKAFCLAALGRLEEAITSYDEALALDPKVTDAWLRQATCLAALGRLEEAIIGYDEALALDPEMADAWFKKASAEEQAGRTRDAVHSYERFLAVAPADATGQIEYVKRRLNELGPSGEDTVDPPASTEPALPRHSPQTSSATAESPQEKDHSAEDALRYYDRPLLVLDRGQHAAAHPSEGHLHALLGRHEEAVACFDRMLVASPQDASLWCNKALSLTTLGRHEEAIACCDRALTLDPNFSAAHIDKGVSLAKLGQREEALACFEQALAHDARDAAAWNNKGIILATLGHLPEALECFDRALGLKPENAKAWFNRAVVGDECGRGLAAARSFKRFIALASDKDTTRIEYAQRRLDELGYDQDSSTEDSAVAIGGFRKGDHIAQNIEVLDVLGWGGFGVVYLVEMSQISGSGLPSTHLAMSNKCALKTLRDEYMADPKVRKRFRNEAQVLVDMGRHPFLLYCQGVYEIAGQLYIASEHIAPNAEGLNSLEGYLLHHPPDLAQSLRWAIQCCYGMEYAFAKGLRCHRDLKPANILVTIDRTVKIADFGLAGVLEQIRLADGIRVHMEDGRVCLSGQTLKGASFGTPTHMPPEQFTDVASCDERSDVYAFGVILYQMATGGRLPFMAAPPRDRSPAEMVRFWSEMRQLQTTANVPQLDSPLFPIIMRCLAKKPDKRYQSFREVRAELESLLQGHTGRVVEPPRVRGLSTEDWCVRGDCLTIFGRREDAIACYDQALAIRPRDAAAWGNKGRCLADLGRFDEAIDCCERATVLDPRSVAAWHNKANVLGKCERLEEAIDCYDQALALYANDAIGLYNKGLCLAKLGRREEAIECYDQAAVVDPEFAAPWNNKALCLYELGHLEEAMTCYDQALTLDPQSSVTWFNKGLCLYALRNWAGAIDCYEQALDLDPTFASAWHNKGLCLVKLRRWEEAITCFERAIQLDPSHVGAWLSKARAEEHVGRVREAVRSYERFITLAPAQYERRIKHARQRLRKLKR